MRQECVDIRRGKAGILEREQDADVQNDGQQKDPVLHEMCIRDRAEGVRLLVPVGVGRVILMAREQTGIGKIRTEYVRGLLRTEICLLYTS